MWKTRTLESGRALPKFYPRQDKLTIQQTLTEYLLCANSCARWWGHDKKQGRQDSYLHSQTGEDDNYRESTILVNVN